MKRGIQMNIYTFLHKINVKDKNTIKINYRVRPILLSIFISAAVMMFVPEIMRLSVQTLNAQTLAHEEDKIIIINNSCLIPKAYGIVLYGPREGSTIKEPPYGRYMAVPQEHKIYICDAQADSSLTEDLYQEHFQTEVIKPKNIQQENIQQENIQQKDIQQEDIQQENIQQENMQQEDIQSENRQAANTANNEKLSHSSVDPKEDVLNDNEKETELQELAMENSLLSDDEYEENISVLSIETENNAGSAKTETAAVNDILTQVYNPNMVKELSESDITILERIVEAEATSEDIYGKMLVANVVINRMNHKNFPDSVEGVVFQGGQFSPINDGRYQSVKVTSVTKEAVRRVLAGEDYSEGALYFFARSKTSEKKAAWFDNCLKKVFKYMGHEFFKEK